MGQEVKFSSFFNFLSETLNIKYKRREKNLRFGVLKLGTCSVNFFQDIKFYCSIQIYTLKFLKFTREPKVYLNLFGIQVVVGSFIADGKKEKKQVIHPDPLSASNKLGHMPVMATGGSSSPSRGTLSESSGGPTSPPNQSAGPFSNNNQHGFSNFPWK